MKNYNRKKRFADKFYDIRKGYFECAEDFDEVRSFIRSEFARTRQETVEEIRQITEQNKVHGTYDYDGIAEDIFHWLASLIPPTKKKV